MSNIVSFKEIIDYIEDNLTENINIEVLAKASKMSVYEFRRVFSFVAGIPISEYIRNRRLSAAAQDLGISGTTVTDIAIKYGYDAPSSFTRAFKDFHGIAPGKVKEHGKINMFTKLDFNLNIEGGDRIEYKIVHDSDFYVDGIKRNSDISDTECCENVWNEFYETEFLDDILKECKGMIYAVYDNAEDSVKCTIGARMDVGSDDMTYIPKSTWACFTLKGCDDEYVNRFYKNIVFNWLESGKYQRHYEMPNLEILPENMDIDDFSWDIRIPIKETR